MAITNLTGTKWYFNERLSITSYNKWNINFNGYIKTPSYMGSRVYTSFTGLLTNIEVNSGNRTTINFLVGENQMGTGEIYADGWNAAFEVDRNIEVIGGQDVENADLIAWLEENATEIKPLEFNETKTALKIYEDLSQLEYDMLEKEHNSFYLVNGKGVYKGEKLIASIANTSKLEYDIGQLQNYVGTLNANCSNLENNKQDKLTAGEGITIENNVISATSNEQSGGVTIYEPVKEE